MIQLDFRSDTVTWPTDAMRKAMAEAAVGDDVYEDDPTILELEGFAAELVGKEAALFVPSGTFGNQLAVFTHCNRGDEVILGDDCHIVVHEVGAAAVIAGVQLRTIRSHHGVLDPEEIRTKIRAEEDIHYPNTGLICLENAHSNGRVIPLSFMSSTRDVAQEFGIPIHLDGARLFNAATSLGVPASEIAGYCDSVMFCLSKGLCAPVGSMLAGSAHFIALARKKRKLMGGGLRQAGVLAAPGLIALKEMTKRLAEDHKNARLLAEKLSEIKGVQVFKDQLDINMVFFDMRETGDDGTILAAELLKEGILVNGPEGGIMRFVCHYWTKEDNVLRLAEAVKQQINRRAE